jgi:hypothetical protein
MSRYAIVDDCSKILNAMEWDGVAQWSPPAGTTALPAPDGVSVGLTYDCSAFNALAQPMPPAPAKPTSMPSLDFIGRFTPVEQLAIQTVAPSSPALQIWLTKAAAAGQIDLTGTDTRAGMDARETEILKP